MKHVLYSIAIAFVVFFCTGELWAHNHEMGGKVSFDSIVVEEKIKLFPDKSGNQPYATINIHFTYPITFGSKEKLQKLQAVFYEQVLGKEYADAASPQDAVQKYITNYADAYRKAIKDDYGEELSSLILSDEENKEPLYFMCHERTIENKIIFTNENLVSFTGFYGEYTGGAHGYGAQINYSINMHTIEPVTLDQVTRGDYQAPLTQIIKEKLLRVMAEKAEDYRDYHELKTAFFNYDEIEATDNFMLTETGMVFTYNPYEIAAYASGIFEVTIPYAEMAQLLNPDTLAEFFPQKNQMKAAAQDGSSQTNYNDFPIAYVKDNILHFFNPETQAIVQFTEETDPVFNCVYSDKDAMFYYTVSRNGLLSIKQVDLRAAPAQPELLFDLNKPTEEFFSETYGEKAKLHFVKGNLLLECDFVWDYYSFTKFYNYSIKNNALTKIDWEQFEEKYGDHPLSPRGENTTKDYSLVYDKAKQLDLSKYMHDDYGDFETEYFYEGASVNESKIVFSIMLGMGDLAHGPYCVADADGTMMQILEGTDMGSSFQPLWSNNNAVFERTLMVDDENSVSEFCYTRAADNTIVRIDQDIDYYAVRKKHPIR